MRVTLGLAVRCGVLALVVAVAATASPARRRRHRWRAYLERPTDMVFGCVGLLPGRARARRPSCRADRWSSATPRPLRPRPPIHRGGRSDRDQHGRAARSRSSTWTRRSCRPRSTNRTPTSRRWVFCPSRSPPATTAAGSSAPPRSCDLTRSTLAAGHAELIRKTRSTGRFFAAFHPAVIVHTADDRELHVARKRSCSCRRTTSSLIGARRPAVRAGRATHRMSSAYQARLPGESAVSSRPATWWRGRPAHGLILDPSDDPSRTGPASSCRTPAPARSARRPTSRRSLPPRRPARSGATRDGRGTDGPRAGRPGRVQPDPFVTPTGCVPARCARPGGRAGLTNSLRASSRLHPAASRLRATSDRGRRAIERRPARSRRRPNVG